MRIEIKVSQQELDEAGITEDELYYLLVDSDDLSDAPMFNVYIEKTDEIEI